MVRGGECLLGVEENHLAADVRWCFSAPTRSRTSRRLIRISSASFQAPRWALGRQSACRSLISGSAKAHRAPPPTEQALILIEEGPARKIRLRSLCGRGARRARDRRARLIAFLRRNPICSRVISTLYSPQLIQEPVVTTLSSSLRRSKHHSLAHSVVYRHDA